MKALIISLFVMTSTYLTHAQSLTFHDYKVETIDGEMISLSQFKGKKVMVVNTASKCGLTPQYTDLQKLYDTYGGENFVIVGFPANNFMNQEPGTNEEIASFCQANYGVTFPMMAKISVKGEDIHPLYQWLTSMDKNGVLESDVKWNFQKYLIDEQGRLVKMIPPREKPMSEEIIAWITGK